MQSLARISPICLFDTPRAKLSCEKRSIFTSGQVTPQSFGNYYSGGAAQGANYLQAAGQQTEANQIYDAGMASQQKAYGNMLGQAGKLIFG